MGRVGGRSTVRKYGRDYMRELGKVGGESTKRIYGRKHFSEAGKAGGRTTAERYFNSDKKAEAYQAAAVRKLFGTFTRDKDLPSGYGRYVASRGKGSIFGAVYIADSDVDEVGDDIEVVIEVQQLD